MKKSFNNIIQTGSALLISWIVVYGIVNVQLENCSAIASVCNPAFNWTRLGQTGESSQPDSPSCKPRGKLRPLVCQKNLPTDLNAKNAGCEFDHCARQSRITKIRLIPGQGLYSLHKYINSFDAATRDKTDLKQYNLSIALKSVPIYILTQSIIC